MNVFKLIFLVVITFTSALLFSSEKDTTIQAFIHGQKIGIENINEKNGCNNIKINFKVFCEEGFAESSYFKKPNLNIWLKQFKINGKLNPNFLGLGISLAKLKLDPDKSMLKIKKNLSADQFLFVIDGYGFGLMVYDSILNNDKLYSCLKFKVKTYIDACFFGMGRGLYFTKNMNVNDLEKLKIEERYKNIVYSGLGFATSFGGKEQLHKFLNGDFEKGFKFGEFLEFFVTNTLEPISTNKKFLSCFNKQQYFFKCIFNHK
jgi:hypothetical protein